VLVGLIILTASTFADNGRRDEQSELGRSHEAGPDRRVSRDPDLQLRAGYRLAGGSYLDLWATRTETLRPPPGRDPDYLWLPRVRELQAGYSPDDGRSERNTVAGGDVEPTAGGRWSATHYGESYNGRPLGCGTGVYRSDDPAIIAVGPGHYSEIPCGTTLQVCLPLSLPDVDGQRPEMSALRCLVGLRVDSCPGCAGDWLDLSEAGLWYLCGWQCGRLDRLNVDIVGD